MKPRGKPAWRALLVGLALCWPAGAGPSASAGAAPRPALTAYPLTDLTVTSFNPAVDGFGFVNDFDYDLSVSVRGKQFSFSGQYGLCGGMTYAALDTFYASNGTAVPPGVVTPQSGPLYDYILTRQYDSLGGNVLPTLLKYEISPQETEAGLTGLDEMSYHAFTNQIVPAINAGHPVPILLLESRTNPSDDHQELVIGYFRRDGSNGQAVLEVYDPNHPGATMYLNTAEKNPNLPSRTESADMTGLDTVGGFLGFFVTNDNYSAEVPYWANAKPTGNLVQNPSGIYDDEAIVNGATLVYPQQWGTTGQFTLLQYGTAGFSEAQSPNNGWSVFAGGPTNGGSTAYQLIPLADDTGLFSGGDWAATLSGDLGGYESLPYEMSVTATFLNASAASLGTLTIGPVTAADRQDVTELLPEGATEKVPVGTQAVRVTMAATSPQAPGPGGFNTAYADNISLTFAQALHVLHFPPPTFVRL